MSVSMSNFLYMIFGNYMLYGLSGSLCSSIWPKLANDIGAAVALLGVVSTLCSAASGITCAFVYKIRRKFGTNRTISIGLIFMTISLILFSIASNIIFIALAFIILGVGNAIVDVGSNSYVIKAYDAKKVSMLHACWGIGSAVGPMVMAFSMIYLNNYRLGFTIGAVVNILVLTILYFMKRKWEAQKQNLSKDLVELHSVSEIEKANNKKFTDIIKIDLALLVMCCFFFGNALNGFFNMWMTTIFVTQRNISAVEGANIATIFFASLTIMRIILGFVAGNVKTKNIVLFGITTSIIGIAMMFIRSANIIFLYFNVLLLGIGIAPIIPFLNHYIKVLFGGDNVSEILSFCTLFSLIGAAASSFFATIFVRVFGIDFIQLYIIVIAIALLAIYLYIMIRSNRIAKKEV